MSGAAQNNDNMKTAFWKTDWFLGLIVAAVVACAGLLGQLRGIDWLAYDMGMRFSPQRTVNPNVVVVGIDDAALRQFGAWPWSRDILATLNEKLDQAQARVVGFALPLDSRQISSGMGALEELNKSLANSADKNLQAMVAKALGQLDADHLFANSLKPVQRIVLAADYSSEPLSSTDFDASLTLSRKFALPKILGIPSQEGIEHWFLPNPVTTLNSLRPPLTEFIERADAVGVFPLNTDTGTQLHREALVYQYGDQYLPSFTLMVAARSLSLGAKNIEVKLNQRIRLGLEEVNTDRHLFIYPYFYSDVDGRSAFPVYSAADILKGVTPHESLRGKTVLVGLFSARNAAYLDTPLDHTLPPVLASAHIVSALLNKDLITRPEWAEGVKYAALVLITLYLMFVLPRFRFGTGMALSSLLLVILLNAHFISMIAKGIWIPLMLPALTLVLGHFILGIKQAIEDKVSGIRQELSESNLMLGQSLQSQGQLDQAFEKYRKCLMTETVCDRLYSLGLDFERKRQFNKAAQVFQQLDGQVRNFRDVDQRLKRNREMSEMVVLGGGGGGGGGANGTLILSSPGIQKPMLGRYQIDREIGRGAMGMVYLGHDPKIGRTVAIKTMVLSQEFDGEQLDDVRKRFFREAETAGRLNHPNIVTIYDVGDDQELSYIAMDYLKGENLLAYCKPDKLLPAGEVLEVLSKVANALEYAHKQNVVHRDIKPANIIYDRETKTLKVTDFGVACLTDASKTKTGTILGSPSYMSPEQLAGKKVDGRSDLFSLGVTMYQMLAGELPFVGESLASLMYKIANEKHPDVRMFRPDLPSCVSKIINKALHKEIEFRFQSGDKLADALLRCRERITRK